MNALKMASALVVLAGLALVPVEAQNRPRSTADSVRGHFDSVNRRVLEMAKDLPEEKYDYRLRPEMRPFGAVIVHIASGNVYAAKAGRGEKVNWDELDPNNYKTKSEIIALMEKSMADADATLKNLPDEAFTKSVEPWLGVIEHTAEHYGLLVAYYRANGLVPPASRAKK
jgi:DinB superfamily